MGVGYRIAGVILGVLASSCISFVRVRLKFLAKGQRRGNHGNGSILMLWVVTVPRFDRDFRTADILRECPLGHKVIHGLKNLCARLKVFNPA